jgi:hypothetical protein
MSGTMSGTTMGTLFILAWCLFIFCFQSYLLYKTLKTGQITFYRKGTRQVWRRFEKGNPAYFFVVTMIVIFLGVLGAFIVALVL